MASAAIAENLSSEQAVDAESKRKVQGAMTSADIRDDTELESWTRTPLLDLTDREFWTGLVSWACRLFRRWRPISS